MMRLFQSPWTASSLGVIVYLAVFVMAWKPPTIPEEDPGAAAPSAAGPSWSFQNPEVDLLIGELKREKEAVAAREKELKELAERLRIEHAELLQLTQAVQQVQAEFDQNITRVRAEEAANLKRLAKTYAAMSPAGAASVLKAMDDSTVVKVLLFMKDSETAAVLEVLAKQSPADAKRAAAISERLRLSLSEPAKNASS